MKKNVARPQQVAELSALSAVIHREFSHVPISPLGPLPGRKSYATFIRARLTINVSVSARFVASRKLPPRDVGCRLLNIRCHGNPGIEFAGQTGFIARRVVEWRLQRAPEVTID
jgi:hypothetical protein